MSIKNTTHTHDTDFISIDHSFNIQRWLKLNVGEQPIDWHLTSPKVNKQRWHFAREKDCILFILRWGHD